MSNRFIKRPTANAALRSIGQKIKGSITKEQLLELIAWLLPILFRAIADWMAQHKHRTPRPGSPTTANHAEDGHNANPQGTVPAAVLVPPDGSTFRLNQTEKEELVRRAAKRIGITTEQVIDTINAIIPIILDLIQGKGLTALCKSFTIATKGAPSSPQH